MKLVSWNVNGIRAIVKKGDFQKFIAEHQPDILCLQETKAEQGQAEIDLPEYEEYWNSSQGRKGYSGTAIFTKVQPLGVTFNFPHGVKDRYGDANKEGRVIVAEYEKFYLVNVYTPNAKPDLSRLAFREKQWDPTFLEYVKKLEKKKPIIFCGDLNVAHTPDDLANPKANEGEHGYTIEEREGIDKIINAGFVDVFRMFTKGNGHYTWWSHFSNARARNVGWRIDYFFVSRRLVERVKRCTIHPSIMGSDHCPVELEVAS